MVDRPKSTSTRWRILTPTEAGEVERAFDELIDDADAGSVDRDKDDLRTARDGRRDRGSRPPVP